jgi:phenylacetate-CoA ligase
MSSGWKERIYARSPHWIRDVLVSLYGAKVAHQRFGTQYKNWLPLLDTWQVESLEVAQDRQEEAFVSFVAFAHARSPFYQEFYRDCRLPSRLGEIGQLPILTKDVVRQNLSLLPTGPRDRKLVESHTSGSTGTPMTFRFTRGDVQARFAILNSYRGWFGVKQGDRRATFSGRVLKPEADRSQTFWQTNWPMNQRFYSTYHLSPTNLPAYVENLARFHPIFLDGYPSALSVVARFMRSARLRLEPPPKVVFTTAETLTPADKAVLEEAFECPVGDQYASSEGAPFVVACEHGRNHFLTYSGVIEVLDESGNPAQTGDMVVTSFSTHHMPLIRYRIGDRLTWSSEARCPCGRNYPLVERISGRAEDYVVSSRRGQVGRLDPIFKGLPPSIIRSQIVQNRIDEVELLFMADPIRFQESHLEVLRHELAARLGEMKIALRRVDDLPLGANGKFKAVVSSVKWEDGGA